MGDLNTIVNAIKEQIGIGRLSSTDEKLRMSLLGQAYVADWKYLLSAAGRMYRVSIPEHVTGGGALTLAAGNAAVDLDQPEGIIAVDAGYRLIPVEMEFSIQADLDAYDDQAELYLFADRTQATAAGATATVVTPQNQLDGGAAFPGRAYSIVTADVTDPVHSEVLAYRIWELTQVVAETAGNGIALMEYSKEWNTPDLIAGPCQLVLICAATVAPNFMGSITFGCVPENWFPTV